MPVFDFSNQKKEAVKAEKTYELVYTNNHEADTEHPIMILEDAAGTLSHHSSGMFLSPTAGTAFVCEETGESINYNILKIDARFESLTRWLGENRIMVRLSGSQTPLGFAVYRIKETGVVIRGA